MSRARDYFVYIATNYTNTVLYIGVTNDLERRMSEHYREVSDAIAREKQLKGWTRARKEALIRKTNPAYKDLAQAWFGGARRQTEGPSTALRSAQDDSRGRRGSSGESPPEEAPPHKIKREKGIPHL